METNSERNPNSQVLYKGADLSTAALLPQKALAKAHRVGDCSVALSMTHTLKMWLPEVIQETRILFMREKNLTWMFLGNNRLSTYENWKVLPTLRTIPKIDQEDVLNTAQAT